MKAIDIMTKDVVIVKKDMAVKELAELMVTRRISGVPVVDDERKLIGIVTEADLVYQDKKLHIPTMISLFGGVIYLERPKDLEEELKKMLGAKAVDIMTKKVETVTEGADIKDIATLMINKRFHILPVMRNEKIVGIISKADIVRTIAKGG